MHENLGRPIGEVFQCATIISAQTIKMDHLIGSIEKGKLVDCVLFDKNPLEDISIVQNMKNNLKVIKDGKIVAEKGKLVNKDLFG